MSTLTASDGHQLAYYQAHPAQKPRGGVLVIQEVFGINADIRAVCDTYASHGYTALAPALFDRLERGVETSYDDESTQRGIALLQRLKTDEMFQDLQAGIDALAPAGRVGVVGYSWGGSLTWAAACHLNNLAAASAYYGGAITRMLDSTPRVPIILHYGEQDTLIPISNADRVREAHPDVPIYVYPPGHGFNRSAPGSHHAESVKLALQRTLDLFAKHVG